MSLCPAGILALAAAVPWTVAPAAELEALVQGLGDETYITRESNTAELMRRGRAEADAVRKLLLRHFFADPEPEIRFRCETILRGLAENRAFLGVQHRERTYYADDGKAHRGVELVTVMRGQPAHTAGLRVGDTIVEIDGQSLDVDDPASAFSRAIHRLDVGCETTLKVDRLGGLLTIVVTTAAVPSELNTIDPEVRFQEWLKAHAAEAGKPAP